jgi:hypothetical protein
VPKGNVSTLSVGSSSFLVFPSKELANRAIVKLPIFLSSKQHTVVVADMYGFITQDLNPLE